MINIGEHRERLLTLLERFSGLTVIVVGDMTLDHYLIGDAGRVSREYPVIILTHERDEHRPGGAANTVANFAALGAGVLPVGAAGEDPAGDEICRLLAAAGCSTSAILRDPAVSTVKKTRIVANRSGGGGLGQHLLRVDRLNRANLPGRVEAALIQAVQDLSMDADGFVMSDYGHGTLTADVIRAVLSSATGRYVGLDSRYRLLDFEGITAATPNLEETSRAIGHDLLEESDLESAGSVLREKLGAEALLITRGAGGMSLFEPDARPVHLPAHNRTEVFDVTGAGDTVVAAFTLTRLAGGSYLESAMLASVAGGISVRRAGAASVGLGELRQALTAANPPAGSSA